MALFRPSSGDVAGFKLLFLLVILYGTMSFVVYYVMHMKFITPLGLDAPLDRFSEARAVEHVRVLAEEIDGRQVGRPGLNDAAAYIKKQLETMKGRAGSNVRIEIEENNVSGSFNMMFLGHSLSLGYKNLTNIVMSGAPIACYMGPNPTTSIIFFSPPLGGDVVKCWVSSAESQDTEPSVLLNGHFDSPPGSPGAGDCGSCVASIMELARLTIDSGWTPPRPIIFLFNGAEELFMLGSHGFMTTHRWRNTIGAFVNVEASGIGGLDVVCQSGPGSWPSLVYYQSAVYPMATSAAQDIFKIVPGDTDYRIFASDHGSIPGLDIIFLHGGAFYHTASDTVDRLLPGSIQARGENLFSVIKAFTNSPKLQNAHERDLDRPSDERAIFFDYLAWFLVYYSRSQAMVFQSIPLVIFLLVPFLLRFSNGGLRCCFAALYDFIKGMLFHIIGVVLSIIFPMLFASIRLLFSGHTMNWFAHPYLAFMMFIPCSLAGLLVTRCFWSSFPVSQAVYLPKSSREALADEARFWGVFGLYSLITFLYLLAGLSGGFLSLCVATFMLPAWISFRLSAKTVGRQSLWTAAGYVIPLIPCLLHTVYFSVFLAHFLMEKMGMMGSLPPPYGHFIPDVIVGATIGVLIGVSLGPLIPVTGNWLARNSIMQFLLHISVIALALTSQFFPYSVDAPKRVVLQHTVQTTGAEHIVDVSHDLSVLDSNSLLFIFKHSPELAKELQVGSEFSFDTANLSHRETWNAIYPLSSLFSRSLKFPVGRDEIQMHYKYFPLLSTYKPETKTNDGSRRVHLEFSLGSLKEVWVAVLNITGPVSGWSFANSTLPAPEMVKGAPPSYICRLSGVGEENWTFWLEANSSGSIQVEVGVVEQYLMESTKKLKDLFPKWVDVIAYSSFLSSYTF